MISLRGQAGRNLFATIRRHGYAGPLPVVAACLIALAVVSVAWPHLQRPTAMREPIVGFDAFVGYGKGGDLLTLAVMAATATALIPSLGAVTRRALGPGHDPRRREAVDGLWLLALMPAVAWAVCQAWRPTGFTPPILPAAAAAAGAAALFSLGRRPGRFDARTLADAGVMMLLAPALAFLDAVALATALGRLGAPHALTTASAVYGTWVAALTMAVALTRLAMRTADRGDLLRRLRGWLVAVQAPLPLLLSCIVPPPTVDPRLETYRQGSIWLTAAVVLWVALGLAGWSRFWRKWQAAAETATPIPLPLCRAALIGVAVFAAVPAFGPPVTPVDPWHPAEQFLPWHQWSHFGRLPFVDFHPVLGLVSFVQGGINAVFFDGSLASLEAAGGLLIAASAAATFGLAWSLAGAGPALLVAFAAPPSDRLTFFQPALLLLAQPMLVRRPSVWLATWAVAAVAGPLWNPSSGSALALAGAPVAIGMAWCAARREPRRLAAVAGGLAVAAVVLGLVTPAARVLTGMLRFVGENARGYEAAHGIAWRYVLENLPNERMTLASPVAYEAIRNAWVWALPACVAVATAAGGRSRGRRPDGRLMLAVLAPLAFLAMSRWLIGRIEWQGWSRTGQASLLWLGVVVPVLFGGRTNLIRRAGRRGGRAAAAGALVVVAVASLPGVSLLGAGPDTWISRASNRRAVPATLPVVRAGNGGNPVWGTAAVASPSLRDLMESGRTTLAGFLQPGETFFDLANMPLLYAVADRQVPGHYSSPHYAATAAAQATVERDLTRFSPPVVVVGPCNTHGEGPATLRSPQIAKRFLREYVPIRVEPWTLLVRPDRVGPDARSATLESRVRLLEKVFLANDFLFQNRDLQMLPAVWGGNLTAMSESFVAGPPLKLVRGDTAGRDAKIDLADADGHLMATAEGDLLRLDLRLENGSPGAAGVVELSWKAEGLEPAQPLRMRTPPVDGVGSSTATLLVPLSWHPRWLLPDRVETLSLQASSATVLEARLLRLKSSDQSPATLSAPPPRLPG